MPYDWGTRWSDLDRFFVRDNTVGIRWRVYRSMIERIRSRAIRDVIGRL